MIGVNNNNFYGYKTHNQFHQSNITINSNNNTDDGVSVRLVINNISQTSDSWWIGHYLSDLSTNHVKYVLERYSLPWGRLSSNMPAGAATKKNICSEFMTGVVNNGTVRHLGGFVGFRNNLISEVLEPLAQEEQRAAEQAQQAQKNQAEFTAKQLDELVNQKVLQHPYYLGELALNRKLVDKKNILKQTIRDKNIQINRLENDKGRLNSAYGDLNNKLDQLKKELTLQSSQKEQELQNSLNLAAAAYQEKLNELTQTATMLKATQKELDDQSRLHKQQGQQLTEVLQKLKEAQEKLENQRAENEVLKNKLLAETPICNSSSNSTSQTLNLPDLYSPCIIS